MIIWAAGLAGGLVFGLAGLLISDDWSLILGLVGGLGTQLIVIAILYRRKTHPELGLTLEFKDIPYLVVGAGLQLGFAVLLAPIAERLIPDGGPLQGVPQQLMDPGTPDFMRAAVVLTLVFITPVVEELVYRGVLFQALIERGERFVTIVTAAVFSGVHVVTLTAPLAASAVLVLPPLFLLGLVMARMTFRSGRLGPAIMTHTGFNAVTAFVLMVPAEVLENLPT